MNQDVDQPQEQPPFNRKQAIEKMLDEKRKTLSQVIFHKDLLEGEIPHLEKLHSQSKMEVLSNEEDA